MKLHPLFRVIFAIALCACLCNVSPSYAQNLITNPNFDSVLSPWSSYRSTAPDPLGSGAAPLWMQSPDLNGGSSGSALVDIKPSLTTPDATNAGSGVRQCIDFGSVKSVNFVNYGGSFFVPVSTLSDSNINATIEIRLFSQAACTGFISGGSQGEDFVAGINNGTWFSLADNHFVPSGTLPMPVMSAEVRAYLRELTPSLVNPDYKANFDKIFLVFNSTTPVVLMDFGVD